jgi:hypothetical protein
MLWLPMAILLFIIFVRSPVAWVVMAVTLLVLGTHPIRRNHDFVQSPLNRLLFKYFSLKMCWDEEIDPKGQYIFVAPPHGVMPMGNLLTVHAMRNLNGLDFRGLTTDAGTLSLLLYLVERERGGEERFVMRTRTHIFIYIRARAHTHPHTHTSTQHNTQH